MPPVAPKSLAKTSPATFVTMELPARGAAPDIRIEVRHGALRLPWPIAAAAECAAWMRELLR